jgi:hypothetical protein
MRFDMYIHNDESVMDEHEIARILRKIAHEIEYDGIDARKFQTILNISGNDAGRWRLK